MVTSMDAALNDLRAKRRFAKYLPTVYGGHRDISLVGMWSLDEHGGNVGSNLIANPSFETYPVTPGLPTGWGRRGAVATDDGSGGVTRQKGLAVVNSGSNSFNVIVDWTVAASGTGYGIDQTVSGVTGSASYVFQASMYLPAALSANTIPVLKVRNTTDSVDVTDGGAFTTTTGAWVTRQFTFQVIAGKTYQIQIELNKSSGITGNDSMFVDDISFTQIVATDSTGNGYSGTLAGASNSTGPTLSATTFNSKADTCYSFDGVDDGVILPTIPLTGNTALTLAAWANPAALAGAGSRNSILGDVEDIVTLYYDGTAAAMKATITTSAGTSPSLTVAASGNFAATEWHHWALTWNGATLSIYLDGAFKSSVSIAGSFAASLTAAIGSQENHTDPFSGLIDDVRLYDRALNTAQVRDLYSRYL